jgi:hypothetical protein
VTRKLNEELKARREALGLEQDRVAQILGLPLMSYFDLEFHGDEWNNVTPFYVVRFACRWLELDLLDFISETPGEKLLKPIEPRIIIHQKRNLKSLSEEGFADACGFHPPFTSFVESYDGIILYPFQVSRDVCGVLEIDQRSFAEFSLLTRF